jgi:hypothetical protein
VPKVLARNWGALAALAIPVIAGIAAMADQGAPAIFWQVNLAALVAGLAWVALGSGPSNPIAQRILVACLLILLALPLVTGPDVNGITRWIPVFDLSLHSGMITIPALAALASQDEKHGFLFLLAAGAIALLQPDGASLFAVTFAAVGLNHTMGGWKWGVTAIIAFFAAIHAVLVGELPAQPFVERMLADLALASPLLAIAAGMALLAGFLLMVFAIPFPRPARMAIAGTLFGFTVISMLNNYPTPLIGYGASSILGYALALGLAPKEAP